MILKNQQHPLLTVDIVVFSLQEQKLCVLLIQRADEPFASHWALPGGFIHLAETLEEAAIRELYEETGVTNVYLEQLYTYGDIRRDPRGRVITVVYYALIPTDSTYSPEGGSDAASARWFSVNHLPELAFDHTDIISYAVRRLRYKLEYSAVGFELLPEQFTLSELQKTYEIILGEKLDKRNFRRRMLQADIFEATDDFRSGEGRPARLYRYRSDAIAEVKARRLFP